jgi:hypothetical protein
MTFRLFAEGFHIEYHDAMAARFDSIVLSKFM